MPKKLKKTERELYLENLISRLANTTELNLDDMEPETRNILEEVHSALSDGSSSGPLKIRVPVESYSYINDSESGPETMISIEATPASGSVTIVIGEGDNAICVMAEIRDSSINYGDAMASPNGNVWVGIGPDGGDNVMSLELDGSGELKTEFNKDALQVMKENPVNLFGNRRPTPRPGSKS